MKTLCLTAALVALPGTFAAAAEQPQSKVEKFCLRYRFRSGETLRWEVVHRSRIRTSVARTTQTAETTSMSIKAWRVRDVKPDGSATFVHMVESVDMRQKLAGKKEVRYNSRTDKKAPPGFEHVAESVGVPLAVVTIDARGQILKRRREQVKAGAKNQKGRMTIPLPEQPVAVGQRWSSHHDVKVKLNSGAIKKVKTLQRFTLQSVKTGVATIRVATHILTPVDDPALEAQLIQRESAGMVRFDVDAGRVISQQMDLDKRVVGFRGEASSLHYLTRFTEKLLPAEANLAGRPTAAKH